ncbi:phage antirepressor KilAC domain-containing protein [Lacicoccus qingdaonensis]|uniref:Phage regulatory protein, rha family n=1 Tax=Lacicoccus qingdaonensis TaxID=576118 RepID=A0A1G9EZ81_9BACL|nr:phage regulatory protein/antirepressor Ant [Salinicoccus qingdaonensis]SDK81305.1 phage regulatory protein, rha family [Salinicoccus qingdaonensis]
MNSIIQIENKEDFGLVVSSRVVAEELNKEHKVVLRDLDNLIESHGTDLSGEIFGSKYKNSRGREYREYLLTKDSFILYMFNIQGYNDFKMAYINKFNEMESQLQNQLPGTYKEALLQLVERVEENEKLQLENSVQKQRIGELKPKADYYDQILKSKKLLAIGQIAKDYGMTSQTMNKLLHDLKIQFKQSGQWLLYAKHQDKGYTSSETHEYKKSDGTVDFNLHTKWTQKGRIFLYELLKKNDILPMIEREG